jgi:uncharacterized membrane protein
VSLLDALTLITALGCGLMAGVFFAFSTFVMEALGRLPPAQGIAAMQSINIVVINPAFLGVLFGTAALCALLALLALASWPDAGAPLLLLGSALYLIGTVLVTLACHVPRNLALARVEPGSAEGAAVWARFLGGWTAWNHVRAAASLAAAAALILALRS